ncbi:MAG: hypothetical protein K2N67_05145, partial [Mucispirillum sp.]|nr:hypothetical protein [Mucispirillum sp.]
MYLNFKVRFFLTLLYYVIIVILAETDLIPKWLEIALFISYPPIIFLLVKLNLDRIVKVSKSIDTKWDEVVDLTKRVPQKSNSYYQNSIASTINNLMKNIDKTLLEFYGFICSAEGKSLAVSSSITTVDESITKNAQSAKNINNSINDLVGYIGRIVETSAEINSDINKS